MVICDVMVNNHIVSKPTVCSKIIYVETQRQVINVM